VASALEKAHAELAFERLDRLADGGLGHTEFQRRAAEAALVDHLHERPQVL